ncbi:exodeoxyribonuclease VII large subunit [Flavobacterium ardleyense]|uniref:exodeoxyribonuclease VII large subunit n=1 Tax=Flavobacterium ardleyense TaxID=2038737 RepID=UPI00298CDC56|nr:exodeoxyribonuclease VII large subunit [Flavobacterium ardleyense]
MSEIANDRKVFTLLEVSKSVQKTISERYKSTFWVKAEMNKLNHYSHSGHCYPELIEKKDGKIIAQIRSNLWRDDYQNINNNFLKTLKEPLKDGIKILFLARLGFDPVYGISLQILDIDPSYTLGDLQKEKQNTIIQLQSEAIFSLNKTRELPLLPQRIAVISVATSKGFVDFAQVLDHNPWGYKFFHYLFPSILQGEKAVIGIISQLKRIERVCEHFDVVAIIRGGGGDVGLSCYNNYELSKAVALFPIPVITGIGHATNETVCEMVSYQNAITPTKIAEFLIQKFHNFSVPLQKARDLIIDKSNRLISDEKTKLQSEVKLFRSVSETILQRNRNAIDQSTMVLVQQSQFMIKSNLTLMNGFNEQISKLSLLQIRQGAILLKQWQDSLYYQSKLRAKQEVLQLENLEKNLKNLDPINILKRGFSITRINGKAVTDIAQVERGQEIETQVYQGKITSTIKNLGDAK